ncbi:MAG: 3-oxoacyl-ACP synthase III family protein [Puniceicoccales bacterium]
MNTSLQNFRIAAISVVTGEQTIFLNDELDAYGGDQARIDRLKKATGLNGRRVVAPGVTALDLAEAAVRRLVQEEKLEMNTLDACVFVTQTPDHFQPSNAAILHGRLGLPKNVACWDMNLGCSGWVYALIQVGALIQTGCAKRVLLVAGDTLSRQVDPDDRATVPLFGDAASATVVEFAQGRELQGVLGSDGSGMDAIQIPAGGMRSPEGGDQKVLDAEGIPRRADCLRMDGAEVFKFSLREVPKAVNRLLENAGLSADDIRFFFFHQANAYILSNVQRRLKVEAGKVPVETLARYGNLSSASIPAVICDTIAGRENSEPLPVVLCGFGVGLSWAAALTDLQGVDCLAVKAYGKD